MVHWLIPLLAFACLASIASSFGFCVQDDAFISFRYAENLAAGHGLLYNPGELPVEGYTNFLWTVSLAAISALGLDIVNASIGMGLLGTLVLLLGIARLSKVAVYPAAASLAAVSSSSALAAESIQGLESTFFAACVIVTLALRIQEEEHGGSTSGLVAGVAFLTRPEGCLLMVLMEAIGLLHSRGAGWRARVRSWALFLLMAVPHLIFRRLYYNDWVPNTFHAKVGASGDQVLRGLTYLQNFALQYPVVCLMGVLGMVVLLTQQRRELRTWLLCGFLVIWTLYVTLIGGDFKPTFRFLIVPLGLLGALTSYAVAAFRFPRVACAAVVFCSLTTLYAYSWRPQQHFAELRRIDYEEGLLVGEVLAQNFPPDTQIAIHAAGIIPWSSRLPTIDMWGLNDRHIAQVEVEMGAGTAGHEKLDYEYVFSRKPLIVVPHDDLITAEPQVPRVPSDFPEDFEQLYQPIRFLVDGRSINLFLRSE